MSFEWKESNELSMIRSLLEEILARLITIEEKIDVPRVDSETKR